MRWLIVVILACAITEQASAGAIRTGAALLRPDSTVCLYLRGEPPAVGDEYTIVLFSPPRVVDAVVTDDDFKDCSRRTTIDENHYAMRARFSFGSEGGDIGIAVHASNARVVFQNGEFAIFTPDAKSPITFRMCSSSEGLHFTTWRGGRRTWNQYWYLGYDVEPDCTEQEGAP